MSFNSLRPVARSVLLYFKFTVEQFHQFVLELPQTTKLCLLIIAMMLFTNAKNPTVVNVVEPKKDVSISNEEVEQKVEVAKAATLLPLEMIIDRLKDEKKERVISITEIITDKKVLDFICHNKVLERAFNVQEKTGLSVATIIAQKGVESAWDNSSLCKKTRNYGNIKCFTKHNHKEAGCIKAYDKKEKSNDYYVKLNTHYQGWNLYKNLIYKRYKKAAQQDNIYDQIVWLKKKGYATDKSYVPTLWKVVKQYNLIKLQEYIDNGYTITSETGKYTFLKQ